jgi:hypothetical protein
MQIPRSLTVAECWQHVGSRGVGRIGFDAGSGPRIHPVDYSCDGSDVYVRTASTSELARFTRIFAKGGVVAFETDQLDASRGERWSVLISGTVGEGGNAPDESARWPSPTPGGDHDCWIRLRPRQVTGRRLASTASSSVGTESVR